MTPGSESTRYQLTYNFLAMLVLLISRAMMMIALTIHHACQFASVNLLLDDGGLPVSFSTVSFCMVYYGDVSYGKMIWWFRFKGSRKKALKSDLTY